MKKSEALTSKHAAALIRSSWMASSVNLPCWGRWYSSI